VSLLEVPGPLYGYRAWRFYPGKTGLHSLSSGHAWPDDRPKAALCIRNFVPWLSHGPAPSTGCTCGIYAWKDIPEKAYSPSGMQPAWGVVELTGHVIEHTAGFRAQYAKPVAIEWVEGIEPAARRYGLIVVADVREWRG